jgi:tetratricopeptide (TPR) repeat protein
VSAAKPARNDLLQRVQSLLEAGKYEDAIAPLEEATRLAPKNPILAYNLGMALVSTKRFTEGIAWLERSLALNPPPQLGGHAHLALGNALTELGRFADAAPHFERSIEIAPGLGAAYYGLTSAKRLTEADRPLVARILSRLDATGSTDDDRIALHFAAGKALDDLGDFAAAIQHFDAANRIRRKLSGPFDRANQQRQFDWLITRYTREFFAKNAAMGDRDETPVLVLGMPRSGTTLLERMLSSHPKVAGGGELSFWNETGLTCVTAEPDRLGALAEKIRREYLALLRRKAPHALRVTDKMPFNFLWIGLVHLFFPRARIVHCRRNPIDTCLSIYTTRFAENWAFANDRADLAEYYRHYVRLMDRWRAALPSERFLDVDYEEATSAPEAVARRLVEFAGLEWDPACLSPEKNPDAIKTSSAWQARQPIYRTSVERWRRYEPWLGELREVL